MKPLRPYKPPSNRPSPDMPTLLRAVARELLTTWEATRDKALIERHLSVLDKNYKPGAEREVRRLMHEIKKYERSD